MTVTYVARAEATLDRPARSYPVAMHLTRWLAVASLLAACTAPESEVRPEPDTIFYPTALTVAPDDSVAFVVSGNSDLRYDSGTVQVMDLAAVEQAVVAWRANRTVPAGCAADIDQPATLACGEADFLIDDAGVRVGNFATAIAAQDLGGGRLRLLVPVRGDPSLTWADWDPATRKLQCSTAQGFAVCDDDHRLVKLRGDDDLPTLATEPYAVFADSLGQFAVVSHFASGGVVSLIDSPRDGVPVLADFVGVGTSGRLSGVAGRREGDDDLIYVQSRDDDRVFLLTVARQGDRPPFLVSGGSFRQNGVGNGTGGTSADSRGIVFRDDGDRAYLINRSPPSLQEFDTSADATGVPANRLTASTDICRDATAVAATDTGLGERAYITCYGDGAVNVVDPRAGGMIETTALVGRGPIAVAAVPSRRMVLVANFLDDSVVVLDVDPASALFNRVVLRIGGKS
ncbi:MAG: hypothetical protein R3B06_21955 [Kofleriaceae bacterium]